MLFIVGSVMYSMRVPPTVEDWPLAPSPGATPLAPSPALAADVCNGPLQPKKVSAIRIVASLPLVVIVDILRVVEAPLRVLEASSFLSNPDRWLRFHGRFRP
jgi:hypothetical protein